MATRGPRRVPRWTLLALTAILVIGIAGWWLVRTRTDAPTRAADRFLAALVEDRTDDAYSQLCAADRATWTLREFEHAVSELVRGLDGHEAFTLDPTGDPRTVHYTLDYGDRTAEFDLDVTRERGTWVVCRFLA